MQVAALLAALYNLLCNAVFAPHLTEIKEITSPRRLYSKAGSSTFWMGIGACESCDNEGNHTPTLIAVVFLPASLYNLLGDVISVTCEYPTALSRSHIAKQVGTQLQWELAHVCLRCRGFYMHQLPSKKCCCLLCYTTFSVT